MTGFDHGAFLDVTSDIERYLGYLKGNETVADYFLAHQQHVERSYESWGADAVWPGRVEYRTTPSDPDLVVDFSRREWIRFIHDPGQLAERTPWAAELVAGAEQSWRNGTAWADGLGGYLRDLLADITRPDADALRAAFQEFSDVRTRLEGVLPVDWSDLDFTSWTGLSSDACQDLVTEFHATVRDQYLTYFTHAETLFGGAGAIIVSAQNALVPMLESVRDGLLEQLRAWASEGTWPADYSGINPLFPDIYDIASKVADLVPGVSEIKGTVEGVADVSEDLLTLFDVDVVVKDREPFEARNAEEVYSEMTSALERNFLHPLRDGMRELRNAKSHAIVMAQNDINPWFMDTLDGISSEPWQHEVEV